MYLPKGYINFDYCRKKFAILINFKMVEIKINFQTNFKNFHKFVSFQNSNQILYFKNFLSFTNYLLKLDLLLHLQFRPLLIIFLHFFFNFLKFIDIQIPFFRY